jgi:formylglycine-generating enzyme required for sulfatase activity
MPASTPATWQRPTDGMVMVYVPEGEFLMGSPSGQGNDDEHPQHTVYLDAFWIDQTEVTNAQYRKCLEAGVCRKPVCWDNSDYNAPDQPVVCVSWGDARTYCEWAGVRLPSEAEWEKAARGTDGRVYPWGNEAPICERANYAVCVGKAASAGSYPAGVSPYGALDMAGNVWEWVADWYAGNYYSRSPARNPQGGAGLGGETRVTGRLVVRFHRALRPPRQVLPRSQELLRRISVCGFHVFPLKLWLLASGCWVLNSGGKSEGGLCPPSAESGGTARPTRIWTRITRNVAPRRPSDPCSV